MNFQERIDAAAIIAEFTRMHADEEISQLGDTSRTGREISRVVNYVQAAENGWCEITDSGWSLVVEVALHITDPWRANDA